MEASRAEYFSNVSILETGLPAGLKSKQGRTLSGIKNSFLRSDVRLFRTDNNRPFTLENGGERGKRNEKAVVGIALSRKKDSLLSVNGASFLTRIDIARIFNSFFFERQQCFI